MGSVGEVLCGECELGIMWRVWGSVVWRVRVKCNGESVIEV